MKHFWTLIATSCFYLFAIIIITVAFVIAASQLFNPYLAKHKPDFEKWASQYLRVPVTVQAVHLSWYQYSPAVQFDNVTVLNQTTHSPALQVATLRISLSLIKSLWEHRLILKTVMFSGSNINIDESDTKEIRVQGLPALPALQSSETPYQSETKLIDIVGWLAAQPHLVLENINLHYTGLNQTKRWITLHYLNLINNATQHALTGYAILQQAVPTKVNISAFWQGNRADLQDVKANLYLYVSGFDLAEWVKDANYQGWQIKRGLLSTKIWGLWQNNHFERLQATFLAYHLAFTELNQQNKFVMNRISGDLGWKREAGGQVFAGNELLIDLPGHLWPSTNFYLSLLPNAAGKLMPSMFTLGYVDLNDIKPYLAAIPIPTNWMQWLQTLGLQGDLNNIIIHFPAINTWSDLSHWQQLTFSTDFNNIRFLPWEGLPGIAHLAGDITWDGKTGKIDLNSKGLTLQYDTYFTRPILLQQVNANVIFLSTAPKQWLLTANDLQLTTEGINVNIKGDVNIAGAGLPIVNLQATASADQVNVLSHYFPIKIMSPELIAWSKQAFLSGKVDSAQAILRGPLSDFPFDETNQMASSPSATIKTKNIFSITANTENIDFSYAPHWPHLTQVKAKIDYVGRTLNINLLNATMMGLAVSNIQGNIPYISHALPQILHVQGTINSDISHVTAFIHASPLEEKFGKLFKDINLTGPMQLQLGLVMPLKDSDKTTVNGHLNINKVDLTMVPWQLAINQLTGDIQFSENSVTANNVQGKLFSQPLQFNILTLADATHTIQATFNTHLAINALADWLALPAGNFLQGNTAVTGTVNFAMDDPILLHLQSMLEGVAITLPNGYKKAADAPSNFSADLIIADNAPLKLRLKNGTNLSAALILNREKTKLVLQAVNVLLGKGIADWPADNGLYLTGKFDSLDWADINAYLDQSNNVNDTLPLVLKGITVDTAKLTMGKMLFQGLHLVIHPLPNDWQIVATGQGIDGQLTIPKHFSANEVLTAQFKKITIAKDATTSASNLPTLIAKKLPIIIFNADQLIYNDMFLGQVSLKTKSSEHGLVIQQINVNSPSLQLQAKGDWVEGNNDNMTHIQGHAYSANVSALLADLNLKINNVVASNSNLNFDISWHNPPYAPNLSILTGQAELKLGAGRITDLGKSNDTKLGIGRLLSIFSLQAIPSHLASGFRDLFQKGYSFNTIIGNVTFKEGNLFTHNLRFEGPVAGVGIQGRIGLSAEDFDCIISVTPYVTSTVPAAAGFLGGPIIGLAVLAVNAIVSKAMPLTTYYYVITGPWRNPTWKSIASSTAKQVTR